MNCISNKKPLRETEIIALLDPKDKLKEIEMKVMRLLLNNYPRKPTPKELEYIEKEEEAEKLPSAFLNMFEDSKEDE